MTNNNLKIFEKLESKTKIYLVIIAVLLLVLCINNTAYIIPSIIIYAAVLTYTIWVSQKRKGEVSNYLDELTLNVDSVAKETLINSPFPLIVLETNGNVIWRNSKFNKEFANVGINSYIEDLSKEIKIDVENNQTVSLDKQIDIENKTYHIIGNYVKNKKRDRKKNASEYITILYFIDITENQELLNKYNESKSCVAIVMIDNYEEIMQRIPEDKKTQVIAEAEKKLYEWAASKGGLIIKKERDTFISLFEEKDLEKMENDKFSILDEIKEIETEDKLQMTLSMAFTDEGETNYEKYETAQEAMKVALGRGGDQAVVRKQGKYTFFGGKTLELEKRTRVKARVISNALEEIIENSTNVMVMGHMNADIDSLGSSLGIYRLAKEFGKEAFIVNNTNGLAVENFVETLKKQEEYKNVIIDKAEAMSKITKDTLLIVVDTHKRGYVEVPELIDEAEKIVIIDHHRRGEDFIDNAILTFHEVYASSAAELVTEIIEYSSKNITLEQIEAESLYAGIMMDTKNFTFKTGVRTFEAAAYLRKYGIDIIKIKKWFQSDLESYNVIADIVKNAEIVNESIGISEYTEKDKNANLICAKAADELLTISNITASFVIGDMGDKICISGRSIGDINVQVILEKLGGGGHITLAGAQLENMTLEEAKTELIIRINEYFTEV